MLDLEGSTELRWYTLSAHLCGVALPHLHQHNPHAGRATLLPLPKYHHSSSYDHSSFISNLDVNINFS